jgi:hypothetical protein
MALNRIYGGFIVFAMNEQEMELPSLQNNPIIRENLILKGD